MSHNILCKSVDVILSYHSKDETQSLLKFELLKYLIDRSFSKRNIHVQPSKTETTRHDLSITKLLKHDSPITKLSKHDSSITKLSKHDLSITKTSVTKSSKHDSSITKTSVTKSSKHDSSITKTSVTKTSKHDSSIIESSIIKSSVTKSSKDLRKSEIISNRLEVTSDRIIFNTLTTITGLKKPRESNGIIDDNNDTKMSKPQSDIENIIDAIRSGFSVERKFNSGSIKICAVKFSWATQLGLLESLKKLKQNLMSKKIDVRNICVFGPKYAICGDLQAGGGGKLKKVLMFDPKTNRKCYEREEFSVGAKRELQEELRFLPTRMTLMCESKYENKIHGRKDLIVTKIFGARVSECIPIRKFDVKRFLGGRYSHEDILTSKIGYVPWGTTEECFKLLKSLDVASPTEMLIDNIDTVSFVSIDKAIEIAECANKYLCKDITKILYRNLKF
jgi:hypothetical protein